MPDDKSVPCAAEKKKTEEKKRTHKPPVGEGW